MKYTVLILLIFFVSCSTSKLATYKVSANDVADIDLILNKNKSFIMHFKAFEDKPPKTYSFKGKWIEKGEYLRLTFKINEQGVPDLNALFDPSLDEKKSVKVIDRQTIEFKKNAKRINIWGLPVEKQADKN